MPERSQFKACQRQTLAGPSSEAQPGAFFIKPGYQERSQPEYFQDSGLRRAGVVYQPAVYQLAAQLARRFCSSYVVDIGCGSGEKLAALHPEFELIGVDFGSNLVECRRRYPFGRWIGWDLEAPDIIPLGPDVLSSCIVVCSDVIEHLLDPSNLLKNLKVFLDHAAAAILTTPERDLVRGLGDFGPPANLAHVREWNLQEMELLLRSKGLHVGYAGLTFNNDRDLEKTTSLVILENNRRSTKSVAPDHWQVISLSLFWLSLQMRQLFRRVTRPR